jgi:hypothetical protein
MRKTINYSSKFRFMIPANNVQKTGKIMETILIYDELVDNKDLLVIQSDLDLGNKEGAFPVRESSTGESNYINAVCLGSFLHIDMVVDLSTSLSLGYSCVNRWSEQRKVHQPGENGCPQSDIPVNTSQWIKCSKESKKRLRHAKHITLVSYRGSDIYEEFLRIPDTRTDMIVSTSTDRLLYGQEGSFFSHMAKQSIQGDITLKLKRPHHNDFQDDVIEFSVAASPVKIINEDKSQVKGYLPEYIVLSAIELREKTSPESQPPIIWRLLTTFKADNMQATVKILQYYILRWQIGILFSAVRADGFGPREYLTCYDGRSVESHYATNLNRFLKIIQLIQARNGRMEIPADLIFNSDEMKILSALGKRFLSLSENRHVCYPEGTLSWASWVICNIGGWRGNMNRTDACSKAIYDGLSSFCQIYNEFALQKMSS